MEIVTDGSTLVLSGDFDARSTWEVRNALRERLLGSERDVVVDLTEVTSIDVTATRVLAYASREASLSGNHVTLRGCGPAVRRMLHLSRLMRFVDVERAAASACTLRWSRQAAHGLSRNPVTTLVAGFRDGRWRACLNQRWACDRFDAVG